MKLPVLGFPSPTAQSTTSSTEVGRWGILGGGILHEPCPYDVRYRKDLSNKTAFETYLAERRDRCTDPYFGRYFEAIH